ncbi:RNA-directed DNA polymerase protein [Dioscorea alata]|uniref:RNA-directed DNA polymerase protein n=1 Tax=Dioscorea alata TaxID=55571 RepID=A0ACB7UBL8_DIOAL|nr:RNA-directed DNA polymerase protein [Dioscorea alata]
MSWLLNSMTNETGENFMYYKTAKEIWEAAHDTYSNKDNTSAVFEIKGILGDLRQGESSVTDYFNQLMRCWQQLDILENVSWNCVADGKQYKQIQEKERIYKFLLGLNQELDEVHGRILSTKPMSSVREAFAEIRREETRRKVMLGMTTGQPNIEGSALAVKGQFLNSFCGGHQHQHGSNTTQRRGNCPWCEHCKKLGHTKEVCWKIHGKPANWQPSSNRSFQASHGNVAATENQKSEEADPFNQEQIEALRKMLQSTIQSALKSSEGNTATVAQKGNFYTALSAKKNPAEWIVDSGASDHMTGDITTFADFKTATNGTSVKIADGTYSEVTGIGSVIISKEITLKSVLFVPNLDYNLLSISKLTKDLNCVSKFSSTLCEFQALSSGRTIGNAKMSAGLYLLRTEAPVCLSQKNSCSASSQNRESALLWHYRLGHPSFIYLKKLFPNLINKSPSFFQCEVCQLSKHPRIPFLFNHTKNLILFI